MAAHLYPGVKSLQLVLDKPYDTIRTTDIRDDLASVKVWYSLTSGFNPNNGEGTLVPSGNSLNVPITELLPGTRYYVKYAFISSIDEDEIDPAGPTGPGSFTISPELTAVVYSDTENVTIYGYLTNDPVPVVTATDGTGGDFTQATGVFKVFNLTEDVTGAGPVYAIKAGSVDSIVGAAIDAVTGVYSCTELTDDGGNVTFTATYNDVVIEQVWNVYRALAGETAPLIQLSTPNKEFIYKDQFATVSLTPSSTITARLVNLSGTITWTAEAYTREGVSLGNVAYTQNGNAITITQAQFDALGITLGTLKVTATIGSVSDVITLYRINDGTEQITVTLSNEAHVIPAYADGTTTPNSYVGSGTIIEVKQGITNLPVDNSSPFANGSWRVTTITADGIVCDITPAVGATSIEYDRHASMDNARDVATIDYTITGKTTSGVAFTIVKRQSFAKSKEGVQGATARSVSLTSTGQAFVTAQNTTTVTPDTVTLTATQSNFVSPTYTWLVDGVAPTVAIGVATGNTFVLKKFDPLAVKVVKVTVSEGTYSVFDTFSVYSFREGDDAFIVGLKNESQTISCDSAGEVIDGQFPFTTQMYAVLGGRLLTSSTTPGPVATFAKVSYTGGIDTTYRISADGIITIDSLDEQFGEAIFSATVNGNTLTKTLNLNKSFDGSDAAVVNVTATTQAFIAAKNTNVISPATVTLTANTYNVGATPTYAWTTSTDGGATFSAPSLTQTGSTFSLPSFTAGTTIVKVLFSGGASDVYDQITIYALKEGSDSISVGLINENQTISCDSAGTPIAGQFPINSELVVFRGTTKLTSADSVVWSKVSETGMTSTIVTTTGAITVSAISATNASATYRAAITVAGVTTNFDKVFTLNKSNNGINGATGKDARSVDLTTTSQAFAYNTSGTTPSPASVVVTATAQNTVDTPVYYEFFVAGVSVQNTTTNTYTYSAQAAFSSMPQQITVKLREITNSSTVLATDVMSMIGVKPGTDGTNAISAVLSNESTVVAANSAGTVASFSTAGGTFYVFDGITSKTGDVAVTYSVASSSGVTISIAATGIYTVTAMSADSGTATLRAVYKGLTIDKIYSIAKSKTGQTGATGTNARSIDLTTTTQAFAYNTSGTTPSPSSVVVTATAQNTVDSPLYYEFFVGSTSVQNTTTNTYTYTPTAAFSSMPQQITVKLRETSSTATVLATDIMSMIGVKPGTNGDNAVSGLLTNESTVVAADSAGTVASFSTAGGTFNIFDGITDKTGTAAVTYSVASSSGVTISIAATGVYTVTALSTDSGTATLRAIYNGVTINKVYSIAKSKTGQTGATGTNSRSVDLTTTSQAFTYNTSGTTPSPSSVVITATAQNTSGTVYYEFLVGVTSQQNTTTNTYTYTPAVIFSSMPQQITVKIREGSSTGTVVATDVMSMIGIKPGTDGLPGTDAVSAVLTNEATTVAADSAGTVASFANAGGTFYVFDGVTDKTGNAAVTYSVASSSGVTISIAATGVYTVTALSTDLGTATLRAVYKGITINKVYSIGKSKTGATGIGINARSVDLTTTSQSFTYNTSGTTPSPSSVVVTATAQNTSGTVYYEFLVGVSSLQNTTTNTYTYTPAAAFSSMPQQITVKIREGSSTGTVVATDIMSMLGIKPGTDGSSAVSGLLTNESAVVAADAAGTVASFSAAGGTFYVFDGIVSKTGNAAVTYSVPSSSGVTVSIATTGVYTVTAMSTDTGTATLRAVYAGVTIDKIYSIAKSKTGATGANARSVDLTTTSQSFTYNSSGTTPSPASVVVTATGQNTSGTVYYEFLVGATSVQNTTTSTYTYTPPAAFASMPQQITVKLREGTNSSAVLATDVMPMSATKTVIDGVVGSSAAVMYARIAGNPSAVSGNVTVSGASATRPTGAQASAVWGASFNVTWSATDPTPTSNDSLYVSNGTFNGTNSTVWSTPYIGSLKVGTLEAITTSTGSLNVTGTFKTSTGSPVAPTSAGTTAMTGYGGIINSTGTFAFGNATTNITFNGTQLTLNGNVVNTANLAANSVTGSGSSTVVSTTATQTTLNFSIVIPSDCFLFLLWIDGGEYLFASSSGAGESSTTTAGITNVLYTLTAGGTRIIPESTEALALAAGAHHWSAISPTPATYAMVLTMTRPDINSLNTTRNTKARVSWLILKK